MELDGYSRPTYNKLVHSATTRLTVVGAIHNLTVDEFVDYTDDLLWRNFLSPKGRNYSRDPDHAHSVITRLILHMAIPYTKFEVGVPG